MDQPFKTKEVHSMLCQCIRVRSDIGVFKALGDFVLESRNLFAPEAARAPRRWVVFFALVSMLVLISFAYFGNLR